MTGIGGAAPLAAALERAANRLSAIAAHATAECNAELVVFRSMDGRVLFPHVSCLETSMANVVTQRPCRQLLSESLMDRL
jgi:hypothetical protein